MNQQINQAVQAMTNMMVLSMTFGMASPIMLQTRKQGEPKAARGRLKLQHGREVELHDYSTHLGEHDFGIERMITTPPRDHKLSRPELGVKGLQLPFITFAAKDQEAADQFVRELNYIAAYYHIDGLDLASLVQVGDKLTG